MLARQFNIWAALSWRVCALVQNVELLGGSVLLQQLRGDLSLGGKDNTILGQDTNGGTCV